jgi:hypothetical protein
MPDTTNTKSDLEILTQLNADFLASARKGDVRRFEQILAEDFMASPLDFLLRDKKRFRDYPRTHDLANGRRCTTSGAIH